MSNLSEYLESLLEECGGLGRFQIILILTVVATKISLTWSLLMMAFAGATPDWWCEFERTNGNLTLYGTDQSNVTLHTLDLEKTCTFNGSEEACPRRLFTKSMNTLVSEFDLVCEKRWVTATMSTIQMFGLLISGFLTGQMADIIGRKPTFYLSMLILAISNLLAGFSTNWIMFAVMRFVIGVGCGMYMTTYHTFQVEFIPLNHRHILPLLPDWALWAAAMGFFAWLLHDWKWLHVINGGVSGLLLLTWWVLPESIRWLASTGKLKEAKQVLAKIAKVNNRPVPNTAKLSSLVTSNTGLGSGKKYTFLDVFRNWYLVRRSILIGIGWVSCGYVYYAISYGVELLTGDIYINMFLLSVVEIPSLFISYILINRLGRRWTCFLFLMLTFLATISVALSEVLVSDKALRGRLVNGFAMVGKLASGTAWCSLMVFTAEIYPTVVRNIGYGIQNSLARVGAMIAPQGVMLSKDLPGLMYFVSGVLTFISAICVLFLSETKGRTIEDTIKSKDGDHEEMRRLENGFEKTGEESLSDDKTS